MPSGLLPRSSSRRRWARWWSRVAADIDENPCARRGSSTGPRRRNGCRAPARGPLPCARAVNGACSAAIPTAGRWRSRRRPSHRRRHCSKRDRCPRPRSPPGRARPYVSSRIKRGVVTEESQSPVRATCAALPGRAPSHQPRVRARWLRFGIRCDLGFAHNLPPGLGFALDVARELIGGARLRLRPCLSSSAFTSGRAAPYHSRVQYSGVPWEP